MAVTWKVTICPLDIARKEAGISAVRTWTNDENPEDVKVETHRIVSALLATPQQQVGVVNLLWQLHLDYGVRQAAIDAYVGDLEAQAEANLEARE